MHHQRGSALGVADVVRRPRTREEGVAALGLEDDVRALQLQLDPRLVGDAREGEAHHRDEHVEQQHREEQRKGDPQALRQHARVALAQHAP